MQPTQQHRALCTDLYELTMAAAYFEQGMRERAAFEIFVREMREAGADMADTETVPKEALEG